MSPIFFQVMLQNHSKIDTQIEFAMADLFELFHQPIPNFNRIRHEQEWMEEETNSLTFPDGSGGSVSLPQIYSIYPKTRSPCRISSVKNASSASMIFLGMDS